MVDSSQMIRGRKNTESYKIRITLMPLGVVGEKLGPYEIIASIGAVGMGECFKATDTRLGRTVAIKVLNTHFSKRFESEARAIAALNHPHICTLYDIGPSYLVM